MLEFSSGNLMPEWFCPPVLLWLFPPPPFPPPHPLWLLAFRECRLGGATDELGGEDEGVPGDPINGSVSASRSLFVCHSVHRCFDGAE